LAILVQALADGVHVAVAERRGYTEREVPAWVWLAVLGLGATITAFHPVLHQPALAAPVVLAAARLRRARLDLSA
jgi:hypothetical protein